MIAKCITWPDSETEVKKTHLSPFLGSAFRLASDRFSPSRASRRAKLPLSSAATGGMPAAMRGPSCRGAFAAKYWGRLCAARGYFGEAEKLFALVFFVFLLWNDLSRPSSSLVSSCLRRWIPYSLHHIPIDKVASNWIFQLFRLAFRKRERNGSASIRRVPLHPRPARPMIA